MSNDPLARPPVYLSIYLFLFILFSDLFIHSAACTRQQQGCVQRSKKALVRLTRLFTGINGSVA